jgi:hypothetical protein
MDPRRKITMVDTANHETRVEEFSQSRAPGVYKLDSFGLPHRTFFATGVPVFLGTMANAIVPPKKAPNPPMLSLWAHFAAYIGEPYAGCRLACAVRGFFENGGHWCYVVVLQDQTSDSLSTGLQAISHLNTVDLVCTPDLSNTRAEAFDQQQMVMNHCDKVGDRFAILDSRPGDVSKAVWDQWSEIDGKNGALYYPWIKVRGFAGKLETVPPCGHIAGVYSRTDRRRGVHKAPANEVLEGVIDLERPLTNHDQALLNHKGVNCLRSFPGRGIRVWGARTLSGQPAWVYVNVRRIFLTAARWMDWNLQEMAFEPNDAKLWARIERKMNEYFAKQYQLGALKGANLQEAFYVKCDEETNPPEVQALDQVITEIGLAPTTPYEFVVVRLIRGARGTDLSGISTSDEIA